LLFIAIFIALNRELLAIIKYYLAIKDIYSSIFLLKQPLIGQTRQEISGGAQ
jgi:hypothetical protein